VISAFGVDHGWISKSLVGGVFKPAHALSTAERKAVGGYKKAKGVTSAHREFKAESAERHKVLADHPPIKNVGSHTLPFGSEGQGATFRLGSKKGGRSVIRAAARNKSSYQQIVSHEQQHAKPRRSEYRLHGQILKDPEKLMREEARADLHSHYGHYKDTWKKTMQGKPTTVYQQSAITGDMSHVKQSYPHLTTTQARRGVKAYKQVQNKIEPRRMSTKTKVALGAGGTAGATVVGGAAYHELKKPQKS
jgi:hypothetical protein